MRPGLSELALYVAAAAIYITLGVFFRLLLLSWIEGAAFLLVAVWLVPTVLRLRR